MSSLKSIGVLALVAIAAGGYFLLTHRPPCSSPIKYHIGTIDAKFGISRADFAADLTEAEGAWEKAMGKNLFELTGSAGMPVNLIYDERQATVNKNATLAQTVNETETSADTIKAQFLELKTRFETARTEYEAALTNYENEGKSYEDQVSYWNARGGADRGAYDQLTAQKASLMAEQSSLEAKRQALNGMVSEINTLIQKYNYLVRSANSNINEINKAADKDFEQGEYILDSKGERINIYEYQGKAELVRVLEHELGHAIGLDHNGNPESIMYYLNMGKGLTPSADDIAALKALCRVQ